MLKRAVVASVSSFNFSFMVDSFSWLYRAGRFTLRRAMLGDVCNVCSRQITFQTRWRHYTRIIFVIGNIFPIIFLMGFGQEYDPHIVTHIVTQIAIWRGVTGICAPNTASMQGFAIFLN